jgi:hypothetical protein
MIQTGIPKGGKNLLHFNNTDPSLYLSWRTSDTRTESSLKNRVQTESLNYSENSAKFHCWAKWRVITLTLNGEAV